MKKNVIAIVMSFALAVGSISWTPVMAAEAPAEEAASVAEEAAEAQEVLPEEAASQDVELPDEASSGEEAQAEEETSVQEAEPVSEINDSADEQDESAPAGITEEVAADEEETPDDPAGAEDVPAEEEKDEEAEEAASEGEEPADADAIKEEISEEAAETAEKEKTNGTYSYDFESATPMSLDEPLSVSLDYDEFAFYKITPLLTQAYKFTINGSWGTEAGIYNSDYESLAYSDNYEDEADFTISCLMKAGETYYLRLYSCNSGTVSVSVSKKSLSVVIPEERELNVVPGESVTLSVEAYSDEDISYEWGSYDIEYTLLGTSETYTFTPSGGVTDITCKVSAGDEEQSLSFTIYVNHFKVIAHGSEQEDEPAIIYADYNKSATLSVDAYGDDLSGLTYEWFRIKYDDNGNVVEQKLISTDATVTTDPVTGNANYVCHVRDKYHNSGRADFRVCVQSNLDAYPEGCEGSTESHLEVLEGASATLKVIASANEGIKLTYKWYSYGELIEGEDSAEYVTPPFYEGSGPGSDRSYSCVVSDPYGNSKEVWFYLEKLYFDNDLHAFVEGHSVWYSWESLEVEPGESVRLAVDVQAKDTSAIRYEWKYRPYDSDDYMVIDGADTNEYSIDRVDEKGTYRCEVRDQYGSSQNVIFNLSIDNALKVYAGEDGTSYREEYGVVYGGSRKLYVKVEARDKTQLTYKWSYRGADTDWDRVIIDGAVTSEYVIDSLQCQGDYNCIVTDRYGNSAEAEFNIYVENHLKVYIEGLSENSNNVTYNVAPEESLTIKPVIEADDDSQLTCEWEDHTDWWDESAVVSTAREYTIESVKSDREYSFTVRDQYGNSVYLYFEIKVDNGFYAKAEGKTDFEAAPGEELDFNVIAHANVGDLKYSWSKETITLDKYGHVSQDTVQIDEWEGKSSVHFNANESTSYYCSVTDEYGGWQSIRFDVKVGNLIAYPENTLEGLVIAGKGDKITLSVHAEDTADAEITYIWSKYDYGTELIENQGNKPNELEITAESSMVYQCAVFDNYMNHKWVEFSVVVDDMTLSSNQGTPACSGLNYYTLDLEGKVDREIDLQTIVNGCDPSEVTYEWIRYDGDARKTLDVAGDTITVKFEPESGGYIHYVCNVRNNSGSGCRITYRMYPDNELQVLPQEGAAEGEDTVDIYAKEGDEITLAPYVTALNMDYVNYAWDNSYSDENPSYTFTVTGSETHVCEVWSCGARKYVYYNIHVESSINDASITLSPKSLVYNGSVQKPAVSVVLGGKALTEGKDYTVECEDAVNAGTYSVTIKGAGSFKGEVTEAFSILAAEQDITAQDMELLPYEQAKINVTGAQGTLAFTSSDAAVATVSADGTVTAVGQGSAKITVSAAKTDNYNAGSAELTVTVTAFDLSADACAAELAAAELVYDGSAKKPQVTSVKVGGAALAENTDYTVSYKDNVNAGTGSVTISGNGKTTVNSKTLSFTIAKAEQTLTLSASDVKIRIGESAKVTVSGAQGALTFRSQNTAIATVTDDGTVTGAAAGTTTIAVNAAETENYKAAEELSVTVNVINNKEQQVLACDTSSPVVNSQTRVYTVTGAKSALTCEVADPAMATATVSGTAITVKGLKTGATKLKVKAAGTADYEAAEAEFELLIVPGKTTRGDMFNLANNVKVTWKEVPGAKYYKVYREGVTNSAESRKDPVIVTTGLVGWDKDPGLTNGHAYRYKIVASLTGKGDSSGDSPLSYSKLMYRLKTVVIRSAKNTAPGKVTVKYDKTSSGDSYVLQYCERQDMVGAKTKVVLGAANTSYVIGGLKKGKTYYISIRVRKKVNGIDYYTTFGVPKKVAITK